MTDADFALNIALVEIVILFFLINKSCIVILLVSMAGINTKRRSRISFNLDQVFKLEPLPPVSNHLTACNEEKTIVESIADNWSIFQPPVRALRAVHDPLLFLHRSGAALHRARLVRGDTRRSLLECRSLREYRPLPREALRHLSRQPWGRRNGAGESSVRQLSYDICLDGGGGARVW